MMSEHPYASAPDRNFWRRSIVNRPAADVDPVGDFETVIHRETKVATAGSCFAQHIARHLRKSGFNYHVTEPGHPILPEKIRTENNYGVFSARYGNIYTARQLLQLMERAYGRLLPQEDVWQEAEDRFIDPFRPSVQPGGFVSEYELRLDRQQHLAAVRAMFETLDVFIFTLGLTECWVASADGAVFPICPGVEGGTFDPARHRFHNQTVDEVVSDISVFLKHLSLINPRAKVILTVSPVPLAATARRDQNVLTATTYSKSVLRVAAEMLAARFEHVAYFPSYEIITGAFSRGAYYADDLRNVLEIGVAHVMRVFMSRATISPDTATPPSENREAGDSGTGGGSSGTIALASELIQVECDEAALDKP